MLLSLSFMAKNADAFDFADNIQNHSGKSFIFGQNFME